MASSMARRAAAAAATTTTTAAAAAAAAAASTFFTKFLQSQPRSSILPSSAATRSFATITTTTKSPPTASDNDDSSPVVVHGPPRKFKMENPFQLDGPRNVIEVDEVKNGTLVRVALPGVGPDGIKVWAENNTVFFAAKREVEHEGEQSGRKYGGSLEFQPELNRADGVRSEIVNGVLRLLVPNAEGGEKKDGL